MAGRNWSIEQLLACKGKELGMSDWFLLDQKRIDAFADVTEDHQYIHVDPDRARNSPFGGTIAHGYLILSLLSVMSYSGVPSIEGSSMGINYGFEKVRFLTPVPAGARVRGRFVLKNLEEKDEGRWVILLGVSIEIENEEKPALIAEWITMTIM